LPKQFKLSRAHGATKRLGTLKARHPMHNSEDWAYPEEFTSVVPVASVRAVYLSKHLAQNEAMNSAENEPLIPDEENRSGVAMLKEASGPSNSARV
jgi:hypothetical protein